MKIGYLGPEGTFSHEALLDFIAKNNIKAELIESNSFPQLQHEFLSSEPTIKMDKIFIPIENSIGGGVVGNLDFLPLITEKEIYIEAEHIQPIRHAIASVSDNEDINVIISHQQPIDQCYEYIKHNYPTARIEYAESTAGAAKKVASMKEQITTLGGPITQAGKHLSMYNYAVIASKATLLANGLKIIATDIQDNKNNATRFVLLGRDKTKPTKYDKTSIAITLPSDKAGALYEVLGILANADPKHPINMTKIESRPTKDEMGEYWFFIDIEGHQDDPHIAQALEQIKAKSKEYKFLGSYPRFRR